VAGFVCQTGPALAIFEPGSASGIPYAPGYGLLACGFQLLSAFHRLCRHPDWLAGQPKEASMASAMRWREPDSAAAAGWAAEGC